ncbi:MAG: metallophosphoesterase [Gemmatimonadales bacterium]
MASPTGHSNGKRSEWAETLAQLGSRVEPLIYRGGWPARLGRLLGRRATVGLTRHAIPVAGLGPRPLRVGYASDFHVGPTTNPAVVEAACSTLASAAPDVLLLGGDYVTHDLSGLRGLAVALSAVPAPLGRFAVLGNHDWWAGHTQVRRGLEDVGVRVLVNESASLAAPFEHVAICGVDDHGHGRPDAAAALGPASGIRLVLMHAPSGLLDIGAERFEVAFCGHTHGGQIALPNGRPLLVPQGALSRRYARGRFDLSPGRTLVVSVGIGCVVVPWRLFAPPEVLLCTLTEATP